MRWKLNWKSTALRRRGLQVRILPDAPLHTPVAQPAEQRILNPTREGSTPSGRTTWSRGPMARIPRCLRGGTGSIPVGSATWPRPRRPWGEARYERTGPRGRPKAGAAPERGQGPARQSEPGSIPVGSATWPRPRRFRHLRCVSSKGKTPDCGSGDGGFDSPHTPHTSDPRSSVGEHVNTLNHHLVRDSDRRSRVIDPSSRGRGFESRRGHHMGGTCRHNGGDSTAPTTVAEKLRGRVPGSYPGSRGFESRLRYHIRLSIRGM